MPTPDRNILLLGGGHAHALVAVALARRPLAGARITLVSESPRLFYSGMLPGHVAGEIPRGDAEIDLASLANAAGVAFVEASVIGIDPVQRRVRLFGREDLAYDLCSVNLGGAPAPDIPGGEAAVGAKPVDAFLAEVQRIEERASHSVRRVVLVGAGAGGTELALALARRFGSRIALTLVGKESEPVPPFPAGARERLHHLLVEHGVTLELANAAVRCADGVLQLAGGQALTFDHLLWVTETRPPAWVGASGLAVDDRGFLLVDDSLRSPSHPEVFGAGDVAVVANHPRARAGVFAVRAAAPLEANLRAAVAGTRFARHQPQRTFLSIMSTSRNEALAVKGPFHWHGRAMHILKDRIDRAFVAQFQNLAPRGRERAVTPARRT